MICDSHRKSEVSAIILAAGLGSRMNEVKQLMLYKGKPLLQHVIDGVLTSTIDKVILVLGYQSEKIKKCINLDNIEIVYNESFRLGQSSSIQTGMSLVTLNCAAALFLMGDQPLISSRIINQILVHFRKSENPIIIPTCSGKRGNPVLIGRPLFKDLLNLRGDTGARQLFKTYADQIDYLEIGDEAIHLDIDTPEDYDNLVRPHKPIDPII